MAYMAWRSWLACASLVGLCAASAPLESPLPPQRPRQWEPLPVLVQDEKLVLLVEELGTWAENGEHVYRPVARARVLEVLVGEWSEETIDYEYAPFVGCLTSWIGWNYRPNENTTYAIVFLDDLKDRTVGVRRIEDDQSTLLWLAERIRDFARRRDQGSMGMRDWLIELLDGPTTIRRIALDDLMANRYARGSEGTCDPPSTSEQQARIRAAFLRRPSPDATLQGFLFLGGIEPDDAFDRSAMLALDEIFADEWIFRSLYEGGMPTILSWNMGIEALKAMKIRLGLTEPVYNLCQRKRERLLLSRYQAALGEWHEVRTAFRPRE